TDAFQSGSGIRHSTSKASSQPSCPYRHKRRRMFLRSNVSLTESQLPAHRKKTVFGNQVLADRHLRDELFRLNARHRMEFHKTRWFLAREPSLQPLRFAHWHRLQTKML